FASFFRKLSFKGFEILDDAVMNQNNPSGPVGMGVALRWPSVSRPARVPDAQLTHGVQVSKPLYKIREFSLGPVNGKMFSGQNGDTGGIVPPVFKPFESINQNGGCKSPPHVTDNPAHSILF